MPSNIFLGISFATVAIVVRARAFPTLTVTSPPPGRAFRLFLGSCLAGFRPVAHRPQEKEATRSKAPSPEGRSCFQPACTRRADPARSVKYFRARKSDRLRAQALGSSPHSFLTCFACFLPHGVEPCVGRELRNWLWQVLVESVAAFLLYLTRLWRRLVAMTII